MKHPANYRVVGAITLPQGKAPFDRAALVIESSVAPASFLQVTAYLEDGGVDGKALTAAELEALRRSGKAVIFGEAITGTPSLALWVLRQSFTPRAAALQDLRISGVLLRDYLPLPDGSFGCLVRETSTSLALRDRWAAEADAEHHQAMRESRWDDARLAAARAFAVERAMSPARIAQLIAACERQGNMVRAQGYLKMAEQSRGAEFAASVQAAQRNLEKEIAAAKVIPMSAWARRQEAMRRGNQQHLKSGLGRLERSQKGTATLDVEGVMNDS